MDNKRIGEYLKRLRLRAGYKQSELGDILSVTDKAISRWESGSGTPELGNLVAIARLYGVTVDDILNCNEGVFVAIPSAPSKVEEPTLESEERKEENPKILYEPWNKFRHIIFFAYILFGIYLGTYQYESVTPYISLFIICSVLVLAVTVVSCLAFLMPEKAYKILSITLDSLLMVISAAFFFVSLGGDIDAVKYGYALFVLLFVMQLLYTVSQFTADGKAVRRINLCALCVSLAALAVAIAFTAIYAKDTLWEEGVFEFIGFAFILSSLAAMFFAAGQMFSKFFNVLTAIVAAFGAALPLLSYASSVLNTLDFMHLEGMPTPFILTVLGVAPLSLIIGWLCEGNKNGLVAVRVTAGIAALALIPFICYTVDSFAVNAYLGRTSLVASLWLTISVFIAVIASYVRAFKPMLIIKRLLKGGRKDEN